MSVVAYKYARTIARVFDYRYCVYRVHVPGLSALRTHGTIMERVAWLKCS
jgi:hypothetical protein